MTEDLPMPRILTAMRRSQRQAQPQPQPQARDAGQVAPSVVAARNGPRTQMRDDRAAVASQSFDCAGGSRRRDEPRLLDEPRAPAVPSKVKQNPLTHAPTHNPGAFVPASLNANLDKASGDRRQETDRARQSRNPARRSGLKSYLRTPRRPVLAAMMLGVVFFIAYTKAGTDARSARPFSVQVDEIAAALGLGIDQVSLIGHRFTSDGDIFDALALDKYRTMASFSIVDARARLEALPWVARANVTRDLPNRLRVEVHERTAFALWRDGDKYKKIDRTGRVLALTGADGADELPLVMGKGAAPLAQHILALVGKYPVLARRLVAAQRVGDRRWTIWLAGGDRNNRIETAILLPEKNPQKALDRLERLDQRRRILAQPLSMIDLRQEARLTLRQVAPVRKNARRSFAGKHAGSRQTSPVKEL